MLVYNVGICWKIVMCNKTENHVQLYSVLYQKFGLWNAHGQSKEMYDYVHACARVVRFWCIMLCVQWTYSKNNNWGAKQPTQKHHTFMKSLINQACSHMLKKENKIMKNRSHEPLAFTLTHATRFTVLVSGGSGQLQQLVHVDFRVSTPSASMAYSYE